MGVEEADPRKQEALSPPYDEEEPPENNFNFVSTFTLD